MYLFVFELCWVFTAAQPFLGCRRRLLPRAALHHRGGELLSISGLWGGLLPITGGCSPSWGVSGAALHLWVVGRSTPHRWGLLSTAGVGSSPSWGITGLLSISGLWGGLLPIAGGCCSPRGWGAALHRRGLGGCSPSQGIAPSGCLSLSCCGARALGRSSVTVMHRLCCPTARGVFLDQGSSPRPRVGRLVLSHWTTRHVLKVTSDGKIIKLTQTSIGNHVPQNPIPNSTRGANSNLKESRQIFFFVSSSHKYAVTHAK